MVDRFATRLIYISIVFYGIGTIIIFQQKPDLNDDPILTNIWLFFYLFGIVFLILSLLAFDEIKIKKRRNQPRKP